MSTHSLYKIFLLFVFSLLACNEKEYLHNISDQKLIDVLVDVHIANSLIEKQKHLDADSLKEKYTEQIVTLNQITRSAFDSIVSTVHLDINRYKTISEAVEDSLSSIKTVLEKQKRAKKKR